MLALPNCLVFAADGLRNCPCSGNAQEAGMIWIAAIAMAVVGGFWVKTRRQRKAKSTNQ
jgi:hypothetical protein